MALETLIKGLAHVGVRVHDLARSRAFYERLGFRLVAGPIGPEPVAILVHPGRTTADHRDTTTGEG